MAWGSAKQLTPRSWASTSSMLWVNALYMHLGHGLVLSGLSCSTLPEQHR